jgi:salicylate hydroxylase
LVDPTFASQSAVTARPLRVAIVGLGVAGGVIGSGLAGRDDIELIAVEKVGLDDHANAGNGLNIGPNALVALRAALPSMADALADVSLPWTRWQASMSGGKPLYEVPLAEVAEAPGIRIRWSELYKAVREPLLDIARFETTIEDIAIDMSVDPAVGGPVSLTLVDIPSGARESVTGIDLLIAVDGRYSAVRQALYGTPPARYLGVANFRTLLQDPEHKSGVDDMVQWFNGPNRLLAYRLHDDTIYLSGNFPTDENGEFPDDQKNRAWIREACTPPDGAVEPACAWLIDAVVNNESALHWSRQQEIEMRLRDDSGHVLFLGDSGHAMAPTLGQGATTALEDASILLLALSQARDAGGLSPYAIPAFTEGLAAERGPRLEFIRRFSWQESDTLRVGADPASWQSAKHSPEFREKLRRLYTEMPTE